MDLDRLKSAVDAKVQAELRPVREKLARLRAALDAYEKHAEVETEARLQASILAALGQEPEGPSKETEEAARLLREALSDVLSLVDEDTPPESAPTTETAPLVPEEPLPEAVVAALTTNPLVEALSTLPAFQELEEAKKNGAYQPGEAAPASFRELMEADSAKEPKILPSDFRMAKDLLDKVEKMRRSDPKAEHAIRLGIVIQILAAETRAMMEKIPEGHHLHWQLSQSIPVLTRIKGEGGVTDFIKGLKRGSEGDWARIAIDAKKRLSQYDKDAGGEEPAPPSSEPKIAKKKSASKEADEPVSYQWPALPKLRERVKSAPLCLVGGMNVPGKVESVKERFGFDVEWLNIDHGNPRAADGIIRKIRNGNIGAAILLEKFMAHTDWRKLADACTSAGVPYAMGDKGGIAAIDTALKEMERRLG